VAGVVDRANEIMGDRHMAIGPSYFMKPDLDERWVNLIWEHSILPYIAEQYFGEESQLELFQLDRLRGLPSTGTQDPDAPADPE
jgi:5-methylcytosine-specific restriction enzyme B